MRRTTGRRPSFAARVARHCEFAGFGPASAAGPRTVLIHQGDRLHRVTYDRRGVPDLFPAALVHQNPAPPEVQAVFSTVRGLAGLFQQEPPLQDTFQVEWACDGHEAQVVSNYAWMSDPERLLQLVLHEFLFDGQALWHGLGQADYHAVANAEYYPQVEAMLRDFLARGSRPPDLDEELMESILLYYVNQGVVDD